LLVPALEREHLTSAPNVGEVHHYWEYPSPPGQGWPELLLELLGGIKELGVEPTLSQEIAGQLAGFQPKIHGLVEELRLVKSPAEVKKLRQAAHYADLGMQKIIAAAYNGVSEIEIFSQARAVQMKIIKETEFDALNTSLLTAAWPARLGTQPHGVPSIVDRLGAGPHIALSFMRVNGYGAECERTFFVTPPTEKMVEMFAIMQEARRRAFALVRPGRPCAEIDLAANGFLREEGFGEYLLHRTGHGLGLGNHEGPWVADGSRDVLAENMLISIEPGLYIPGMGGFRHSDTVLVTKDDYESLTHFPTDLESLTLRGGKPFTRLRGALVRKAVGI
jgi:Xaa-Pro aminopeptidase